MNCYKPQDSLEVILVPWQYQHAFNDNILITFKLGTLNKSQD